MHSGTFLQIIYLYDTWIRNPFKVTSYSSTKLGGLWPIKCSCRGLEL